MHSRFLRAARGRGWGGPPWAGGGRGGRRPSEPPSAEDAAAWFAGRLPEAWFTANPDVTVDREEIVVVGALPAVDGKFGDEAERAAAESGRIARFREETREERIEIARQAEHRYGRKVAWGARVGDTEELFTTLSAPVMTRLRQPERRVLDTLVDAGVARSRSEALAWAVRLVGEHTEDWLAELRDALSKVDKLRTQGPDL
jgi:Arc/MetJ-type ribon-helix-helix transcriptional regulator